MKPTESYDLAVVGGGIAGMFAALVAGREARVALVSTDLARPSSSWLAQGGIAAAVGPDDGPRLHVADTLRAGRGLSRESAVAVLAEEAAARIADLADLGVRLDPEPSLEGGHSRRRIVHAGGAETGQQTARVLAERLRDHSRVTTFRARATGVWTLRDRCVGILTDGGPVAARATVLATGGFAALFARTTNPSGSAGQGIELAYRAGAAVADLELVQFHPTVLAGNGLLLTEALRGDGATLLDADGLRFVDELAPRDVVARAIAASGTGTALLDLRPLDRSRFSALMERIATEGYDPAGEPLPVAPAAHYTMGGIVTDLDARTEVPGLYAAGECACTGVHGANRLASNSLLECLVFGRRAALAALAEPGLPALARPPAPDPPSPVSDALRAALWADGGLVREEAGLRRLLRAPHALARLLGAGALARRESRGAHFRVDFPAEDPALAVHVVHRRGEGPSFERWV